MQNFIRKTSREVPLELKRRSRKDNIKIDLRVLGCDMDWIQVTGLFVSRPIHGNESPNFINV